MKKLICALIFCLALVFATSALGGCWGGYATSGNASGGYDEPGPVEPDEPGLAFTLNSDEQSYSVSFGTYEGTEIEIPAEHDSLPVTTIAYEAFKNRSEVTSIVIPSSVTSIEGKAFYGCSGLTNLVLPSGLISFGNDALKDCTSLTYLEEGTVRYFGNEENPHMILVCSTETSVESVTVNEKTKFINSSAFSKCSKLQSVTIPKGVLSINGSAFSRCTSLKSVVFEEESLLNNIGSYAFQYCGITEISLPEGLLKIGDGAFYNCSKLVNMSIPSSIKELGGTMFDNCSALGYNYYDNALYLGNDSNPHVILVKGSDSSITSCTIHQNTKIIYSNAFKNFDKINSITIPDGVISVGDYSFNYCTSLHNLVIPESVTYIGNYSFYQCWGLRHLVILTNSAPIGLKAFEGCVDLYEVNHAYQELIGKIYFKGTKEEWDKVMANAECSNVTKNAPTYFYSETQPAEEGNYWHFDQNGDISLVW